MTRSRRARVLVSVALGVASLSLVLAASLQSRAAYRYLDVFQQVWTLTRANYVEPVDESTLLDGAFRGMLTSLDGASAFLAPGEEKLLASPPGAGRPGFETLPSGGGPIVVRVDPDGPAARAGLEVGDQIWKAGGKPLRQMAWPQVKRKLSGAPGGKLDLTILEGRSAKLKDVTVDLELLRGPGYTLQRKGPALHLRIQDPDAVDARALARDLGQRLAAERGASLLVDLRGTVGLDVDGFARVAGALVPAGPALRIVPRTGEEQSVAAIDARPPALPRNGTTYVLVDGTTAGTGEALAQSLREKVGATLCGRSTYGLGSLPEVIPLSKGGSLLLTTREMRSPGGATWSDKGLEPDKILAPQYSRAAEDKSDLLLDEALRWIDAGAKLDRPAARPAA